MVNFDKHNIRPILVLMMIVIMCIPHPGLAQTGRIYGGATIGIGMPKIPVSQWRSPVSITGSLNAGLRITPYLIMQINGGALYTFNLGSIDSRTGKLRFNLFWASLDLGVRLRGTFRNETFFIAGGGDFYLSQQFDQQIDERHAPGICIGLIHWTHHRRISSVVEIRWFFLFEPNPHPQVATLTLGIRI